MYFAVARYLLIKSSMLASLTLFPVCWEVGAKVGCSFVCTYIPMWCQCMLVETANSSCRWC